MRNLKDIQNHISNEEYCNHPGKSSEGYFFEGISLDNVSLLKTIYKNGFAILNIRKKNLLSIVRSLPKIFGQQLKDVGINKKYIARVEAVKNGRFYINTAFSQPLHTDEGYRNIFPRFVSLYCVRSSNKGGISTIVKINELLPELFKAYKEDVKNLYQPDFIQIDTQSGKINKQLLFKIDHGITGISYSPILRGLTTSKLGYDMISWINKFIHEPINQYRFSLSEGDLLIMDNCQVLHGRTAFNEQDNRLLLRFWNELVAQ